MPLTSEHYLPKQFNQIIYTVNLLYNGQFLHQEELKLPITNRAFQFNDGFFETMLIVNDKIRFWQDHLDRIQAAAKSLKLDLPDLFTKNDFEDKILQLAEQNGALKYGRSKFKVWRSGTGIYTPETNTADWLLTIQPATAPADNLKKVGICTGVRTNLNPLSFFKGPNSPLYVMAALEAKERGFDDLVILNKQDLISELTSSNIFWYQQHTLFTPSLETGCINGIMRRNLLNWCRQEGIKTKEVYFDVDNVLQAEAVFSANVTGIKEIHNLIGFDLSRKNGLVSILRSRIEES